MSLYQRFSDNMIFLEGSIHDNSHAPSPKTPWHLKLARIIKLLFLKISLAIAKVVLIAIGTPTKSFCALTKVGDEKVYLCSYSYREYKQYHHLTQKRALAMVVASVTIIALAFSIIFPGKPVGRAATNTWQQTDWSGGADTNNTLIYPQSGNSALSQTKYYSKDPNLVASASNLTLANASSNFLDTTNTDFGGGTITDTTDTDFNNVNATHSSTAVSGTGAGASVVIGAICNNSLSNAGGGSWCYRRSATITGSTVGPQTNYQVNISLTTASLGNPYANINSDGSDIRFTNSSGTELSYWIESWSNTGTSSVWVEVDSIPASPSTVDIYMYYGNASATSSSSISSTFVFGDDFSTNTLSGYTSAGTWAYDSTNLLVSKTSTSGGGKLSKSIGLTDNFDVYAKVRIDIAPANAIDDWVGLHMLSTTGNTGDSALWIFTQRQAGTKRAYFLDEAVAWRNYTNFAYATATWYKMRFAKIGTNFYGKYWLASDTEPIEWSLTQGSVSAKTGAYIGLSSDNGATASFDDFRVRNYVSSEPSVSALGSETALSTTGTFTYLHDSGAAYYWGSIVFNTTLNGGAVALKVRTFNNADASDAAAWASCTAVTSNALISTGGCATGQKRYVQYQAVLTASVSSPSLNDVTIYYGSNHSGTGISGTGTGASVVLCNSSLSNAGGGSWCYRRSATITGSTVGPQTNYQVNISLTTASLGNPYANINSDGSDIRFTNSSGTELSYWIESWSNTGTSSVWVEVDSIPASPSTVDIYMYYGNASATSSSNGTNTFTFFDDFSGDLSKWTSSGTSVSATGGALVITPSPQGWDRYVQTSGTYANNIVIQAKVKSNDANPAYWDGMIRYGNINVSADWEVAFRANQYNIIYNRNVATNPSAEYNIASVSANTYYTIKLIPTSSGATACVDATCISKTDGVHTNKVIALQGISDGVASTFDYVFVKTYLSSEPSVGALGSETAFSTTGIFTSYIHDSSAANYWGNIVFNVTLNGGTAEVKVRAFDQANASDATDWASCTAVTSNSAISTGGCATGQKRYVQYKVALANGASLDDVTIYYGGYVASAWLSSSPFDTGKTNNVLRSIAWNEGTLPANTDVQFQVRTADSLVNLLAASWCGKDDGVAGSCNSTSAYYFTDPAGGETIDDTNSDGYADEWIQYKAILSSSTGLNTPTLSGVTLNYDLNAAPIVSNVTASQINSGADIGKVSIGYNISDAEQASVTVSILVDIGITLNEVLGNSSDPGGGSITVNGANVSALPVFGTIQIENEQITYTGKSGNDLTGAVRAANSSKYASHASGSAVWFKGSTFTGDTGAVSVTSTPAAKTVLWNIASDLSVYYATAKVRVSANDAQIGNPVGAADSNGNPATDGDSLAFALDTKAPVYTTYASKIDSNSSPVLSNNISSSSGQNATYMRFSNYDITALSCTDTSTPWESYAATKAFSLSPNGSGVSTVYYQFKDDHCNMISGSAATPQKPLNMQISDLSAPPASTYKILVWWDTVPDPGSFSKYNVWRSTDNSNYGSTPYATITSRTTNFCFDEGDNDCLDNNAVENLNNASTYYYKITAEDIDGISPYGITSATNSYVSAKPDGSVDGEVTPSDTESPSITYNSVTGISNITSSGATFTFTSTELSNSFVAFSNHADYLNNSSTYLYEQGTPTLINTGLPHTVTLQGLSSGTSYHYCVGARDAIGNRGCTATDYTFTTLQDNYGPSAITDLNLSGAPQSTHFTLTWTAPTETVNSDSDYNQASFYTIKYSTTNITSDALFTDATTLPNPPKPEVAGTVQTMTVTGLAPDTYFFAIKASDSSNHTSPLSNIRTVTVPPQANTIPPTITINPATSAVKSLTSPATSVTISWTTDVNSSSLVDYGTDPNFSYGSTQGDSGASTKTHSVTLSGLAPGGTYYYRVKSTGANGYTGQKPLDSDSAATKALYTFTTDSAESGILPEISSITKTRLSATSYRIEWTTANVISDSVVAYSISPSTSYNLVASSATQTTNHSLTLSGLTPSTTYNFQVRSRNGTQLSSSANDTFSTTDGVDVIPPIYTVSPQVLNITGTGATITWSTSENSNSYVDFGTTQNIYSSTQGNSSDSTLSHTVVLASLTTNTTYYYQVRSTDASGNTSTANNSGTGYSFTTTSGTAVTCPSGGGGGSCPTCPTCQTQDTTSPEISDITITDIAFNSATITWKTDEDANSNIRYGQASYTTEQNYPYSSSNLKELTKNHTLTIHSLDSSTTYFFKVSSSDSRGNVTESDELSFKTIAISDIKDKDKKIAEEMKKEFEEIAEILIKENIIDEETLKEIITRAKNPPFIIGEGPRIKNIKSYGATIYWETDKKARCTVRYRPLSDNRLLTAGHTWRESKDTEEYHTNHEIDLLGLAPSTMYSFQVESQDMLGNASTSPIKTFITEAASSIFSVEVTDISLSGATINWETSNPSTSLVEYGLTPIYGNKEDKGTETTKNHKITLSNLTSGTTYHFRVRSIEQSGNILTSDDYTFTTYQMPQITKYTLGEVTDNTITLTWTSNIPIDSNIRYANKDTQETKIQGKPELIMDHTLTLNNLEAGKTYTIEISGRDLKENQATLPQFDVQTGMDTTRPELSQVRSQAAILSGSEDRAQAIISWKTNELSTTQVLWDLGSTKGDIFSSQTKEDTNLTTNHISVITQFKPGTVYRFKVVSKDKFGNQSISQDYSILTPIKRQSVIQMIMSKFEDIFGWVKKIGK